MADTTSKFKWVRKRDGSSEPFTISRIEKAIEKALVAVDGDTGKISGIAKYVLDLLAEQTDEETVDVETIQDAAEQALILNNEYQASKAFILYRQSRAVSRDTKATLGVKDDLKLSVNSAAVLHKRYLRRNEQRKVIETPAGMFRRVARAIAQGDKDYASPEELQKREDSFYAMMTSLDFLPNSPTLMNAGTHLGQLSACFVIPVEDSIAGIFEAVKDMALIHQSGGGTGFSFSRLRPANDVVRSTGGIASGPVSFMHVFDMATEVIKQGGRRRGANMGILRVDHPDIFDFITSKVSGKSFRNFNLSVAATNAFMDALKNDGEIELVNPRTGKTVRSVKANDIFELIIFAAWKSGDPGLIFLDRINEDNPTPTLGAIESTNPCGEQPLLPYESCNLGSINLSHMIRDGEIDWDKLATTVKNAVHFLDNVIKMNRYPLDDLDQMAQRTRKIGLGVMGFADMLIALGIPYQSDEACATGEKIMKFISENAREKSAELAKKKGPFPLYEESIWKKREFPPLRNSTLTTVAPTGTISIIANASSGIEPLFAISYYRNILEGSRLVEENEQFVKIAQERGFYSKELMSRISNTGSVADIDEVPQDVKELFVTAFDVSPEWHVRMQAAFQKHTDNAVSKTVNLPAEATQADVKKIYLLAYELGCKGITIYRYGSLSGQVLSLQNSSRPVITNPQEAADEPFGVEYGAEEDGQCRSCAT